LPRRVADHNRAGRDLAQHHGRRADCCSLADRERPQHLRIGADDYVVADGRMPFMSSLVGRRPSAAERYPLIDRAIIADLGGLTDDDADAVVDEEALADRRAGM